MTRLVVVGDAVLDRDVDGSVSRICPDAPAPVLDQSRETCRPGGAALAAALAARSGAEVALVAAVGADDAGDALRSQLDVAGVELLCLPTSQQTRVKSRLRAEGRTLLRLDRGARCEPDGLPDSIRRAIAGAGSLLVSDYAGGVVAHPQVHGAVAEAVRAHAVAVWDPHPRGCTAPAGVRLVTPSEAECEALGEESRAGSAAGQARLARVRRKAASLRASWSATAVAVTLGRDGALLAHDADPPLVVPAPQVGATDSCGAGDAFAAAAAVELGRGALLAEAVEAAVRAASEFVAGGGAAAYERPAVRPHAAGAASLVRSVQLAGGTVVATGGCFDLLHAGHVATLAAARSLGDCLVVLVNSDASIARLKGADRPVVPEADRVRVLSALESVDAVVVFDEDTPIEALRALRPQLWVKGDDYAATDLPERAVLAGWGGEVVLVPYLAGRSTTRLIESTGRKESA